MDNLKNSIGTRMELHIQPNILQEGTEALTIEHVYMLLHVS